MYEDAAGGRGQRDRGVRVGAGDRPRRAGRHRGAGARTTVRAADPLGGSGAPARTARAAVAARGIGRAAAAARRDPGGVAGRARRGGGGAGAAVAVPGHEETTESIGACWICSSASTSAPNGATTPADHAAAGGRGRRTRRSGSRSCAGWRSRARRAPTARTGPPRRWSRSCASSRADAEAFDVAGARSTAPPIGRRRWRPRWRGVWRGRARSRAARSAVGARRDLRARARRMGAALEAYSAPRSPETARAQTYAAIDRLAERLGRWDVGHRGSAQVGGDRAGGSRRRSRRSRACGATTASSRPRWDSSSTPPSGRSTPGRRPRC